MSQVIEISAAKQEIEQAFLTLEKAEKATRPAMQSVARFMKNRVKMSFRTGTDPYGKPWAKLKSRQGQILVDTRRLANSIGTRTTADSAEIGTNVEYAPAHQNGVNKPVQVKAHIRVIRQAFGIKLKAPVNAEVKSHTRKMNLPARRFLPDPQQGLPASWEKGILKVMTNRLKKEGLA